MASGGRSEGPSTEESSSGNGQMSVEDFTNQRYAGEDYLEISEEAQVS